MGAAGVQKQEGGGGLGWFQSSRSNSGALKLRGTQEMTGTVLLAAVTYKHNYR